MNNGDLPPVLVLFDVSGLLEHTVREWQEYDQAGVVFVPQVVYEEIQFLSDRAPAPELEKSAREFLRFFPNSTWQQTLATASHPSLMAPPGQALSKQARLAIAIAESAYGFALAHPYSLVVFVSNQQPLLMKLQGLNIPNLCGITSVALLQWIRTSARPLGVTRQLQVMGRSRISQTLPGVFHSRTSTPMGTGFSSQARGTSIAVRPATQLQRPQSATKTGKSLATVVTQMIGTSMLLLLLGGAGLLTWRMVQPQQFNQFWTRQVTPYFPK